MRKHRCAGPAPAGGALRGRPVGVGQASWGPEARERGSGSRRVVGRRSRLRRWPTAATGESPACGEASHPCGVFSFGEGAPRAERRTAGMASAGLQAVRRGDGPGGRLNRRPRFVQGHSPVRAECPGFRPGWLVLRQRLLPSRARNRRVPATGCGEGGPTSLPTGLFSAQGAPAVEVDRPRCFPCWSLAGS